MTQDAAASNKGAPVKVAAASPAAASPSGLQQKMRAVASRLTPTNYNMASWG